LVDYFIRFKSGTISHVSNPHPFEYKDISLFAWEKTENNWQVVEATTGILMTDENGGYGTKEAVILAGKKVIDRFGIDYIKSKIKLAQEEYSAQKPKPVLCNVAEV